MYAVEGIVIIVKSCLLVGRILGGGVCEPGRQLASLLLDEVPDGNDTVARLLGDDLGGILLLHDSVVDAVLLGLVQRAEKGFN